MGSPVIIDDDPVAVVHRDGGDPGRTIYVACYDDPIGMYDGITRIITIPDRTIGHPGNRAPGMPVYRVSAPGPR